MELLKKPTLPSEMNKTFTSTTLADVTDSTNAARADLRPSILKTKPNNWGSCTQRHSAKKVSFHGCTEVRSYELHLPEGKKMHRTRKLTLRTAKKRAFNKGARFWMTCEVLKNWVKDHRRKVEEYAQRESKRLDCPKDAPQEVLVSPLKRRASSDDDPSCGYFVPPPSTKRRKLDPAIITAKKVPVIPSSTKEWVHRTNILIAGIRRGSLACTV